MGVTFWVDYEQLGQGIAVIKGQHLHWVPWTILLKPLQEPGLHSGREDPQRRVWQPP